MAEGIIAGAGALVTGAGQDVGLGIARAMAAAGAALAVVADVADPSAVGDAVGSA